MNAPSRVPRGGMLRPGTSAILALLLVVASSRFSRAFLVVAPGLKIKDRLRVLLPNDPESYYRHRELVPTEFLGDLERAKIVITNYHAFKLRETLELSKGGRRLLRGRGPELSTLESEGQMLQRVMPDLMGLKNVLVLNDEAHHCRGNEGPSFLELAA
jgi:type III restriction enzyme